MSWVVAIVVGAGGLLAVAVRYVRTPDTAVHDTTSGLVVQGPLTQIRDVYLQRAPNVGSGAEISLAGRALHLVDGRLPTASQVSLVALRVKPAVESRSDADADAPPYLIRDVDTALRGMVAGGGMVLLHGRAAAGKSRAALQAVRELHPHTPLLVPRDGVALRELVEADVLPERVVVWLDDLERFIGAGGLDLGVLQRLCPTGSTTGAGIAVVATMRDDELSRYDHAATAPRDTVPAMIDQAAVQLLEQLRPPRRIKVDQHLSPAERDAARTRIPEDPRIGRAVAANEGFAVYLAAGVAMLTRWSVGDGPLFQTGQALISAAVDCRRAGVHDPVHADLLFDLYREFLPAEWRDRADLPSRSETLAWACERVLGASSCLEPRRDHQVLAADYLLDHVHRGDTPLRDEPVADATWQAVLGTATSWQASDIGAVAYFAGRKDVAERAVRGGAEAGETLAMHNLGVLLAERDEQDPEAEKWWRKASALGDVNSMFNVSLLLKERNALREAERWWRTAAHAGHAQAMVNLAHALQERGGDLVEVERWLRTAADTGLAQAMINLGVLLYGRGDLAEAEHWHHLAADTGETTAMVGLGVLLTKRGEHAEAERWWRSAADGGEALAMYNLGALLAHRDDLDEAERWYRAAAEAGNPQAPGALEALTLRRADDAGRRSD